MRSKTIQKESTLRSLVRKEITRIIKENEQIPGEEASANQEAPKEKEPEEDRSEVLEKITRSYSKALKNNLQQLSIDELADSLDSVMSYFDLGKDSKIQVLRSIRGKIES